MLTSYEYQVEEQPLQPIWHLALTVHCLMGLFGAVWISDDFDYPRALMIAIVGVPALTSFHLLHRFVRNWAKRWPLMHKILLLAIFMPFTWGQVIFINALGDSKPERVHFSSIKQAVPVTAARGPLGLLYQKRW